MNIYIDSNVFISAISKSQQTELAENLFEVADSGKHKLYASLIVYAEVLWGNESGVDVSAYIDKFPSSFCDVNKETIVSAAGLRKAHPGLKLPDAIHLATAINQNCEILVTDDIQLQKIASKYLQSVGLDRVNP